MFIDFKNFALECQPKRLTADEVRQDRIKLIAELMRDNVDPGLVQWVDELIVQAEESGYDGGYSDAHWYAKGIGDGA